MKVSLTVSAGFDRRKFNSDVYSKTPFGFHTYSKKVAQSKSCNRGDLLLTTKWYRRVVLL